MESTPRSGATTVVARAAAMARFPATFAAAVVQQTRGTRVVLIHPEASRDAILLSLTLQGMTRDEAAHLVDSEAA